MRRVLGFLLAALAGCQAIDAQTGIVEGTTVRVEASMLPDKVENPIKIFSSRALCLGDDFASQRVEDCVPYVNPGTGEVRVSFQVLDSSKKLKRLPLTQDMITVTHNDYVVGVGEDGKVKDDAIQLVSQGGSRGSQLFILLIDNSASFGKTGSAKVKEALLSPEVIDAFLPKDAGARSGVMLLKWNDKVVNIDGGSPLVGSAIIEKRNMYKALIEKFITPKTSGYSHLYKAIDYTMNEVLAAPPITGWIELNQGASPTIVVLTDGFNNESPEDTCESNVERLKTLNEKVSTFRGKFGKTRVFTVGLGAPLLPKTKIDGSEPITAARVCGDQIKAPIDGHLENFAVDNVSLQFLARAGEGESFVRSNSKGLADVFTRAATQEYSWFTIKYRRFPFELRRSFTTMIRLKKLGKGHGSITFHPSPWLDGPTVQPAGEDGVWTSRASARAILVPLLSLLGGLVALRFTGPAFHNLKRLLTRRGR